MARLRDVEYPTLDWVAWVNAQRSLEKLDCVPPAEFEEQFVGTQAAQTEPLAVNSPGLLKTRRGSGSRRPRKRTT